jgi:hypothetical protein
MSNPISSVTQAPPVQSAAQAPAANPKAPKSTTQPAPADSVTISNNSAKAILQEAQETPAQTAQEANGGDSQARRLLAREAAPTIAPKH